MAAVQKVSPSTDDPTHRNLVHALSKLSAIVRSLDADAARDIEQLARGLSESPARDRDHADLLQRAFDRALDVYSSRLTPRANADEREAYMTARDAVGRVDGAAPLQHQTFEVAMALRALANLAAVVDDVPPPFTDVENDVQIGYDAAALRDHAARASSLVRAFGLERDWKQAGTKASQSLRALADVVAVAPLSLSRDRWRAIVTEIRYQALELEREGVVSLDRSDRIKAALVAATTALSHLAGGALEPARPVAQSASLATSAIDPGLSFVFQRAIIQDAMRSVVDTYVVVGATFARGSSSASR